MNTSDNNGNDDGVFNNYDAGSIDDGYGSNNNDVGGKSNDEMAAMTSTASERVEPAVEMLVALATVTMMTTTTTTEAMVTAAAMLTMTTMAVAVAEAATATAMKIMAATVMAGGTDTRCL